VNGQFGGAIFVDILLETLNQQVANVSYRGIGSAAIIEQTGNIIASKGKAEPMTNFKDIPGLGAKFDEMAKNKTGFFKVDTGDDGRGHHCLCHRGKYRLDRVPGRAGG
jgi:methyl-accepting chemotaxis protein